MKITCKGKTQIALLVNFVLTLILLTVSVRNAQSQSGPKDNDPCGCNAALIPTKENLKSNKRLKLAVLKMIDEHTYDKMDRGVDSAFGIVVEGIPMQGNLNYKQFDEARRDYFRKETFDLDQDESIGFVRSYMPKENLEKAWLPCKQNCARNEDGFHCWCNNYDADTVDIEFRWKNPRRQIKPIKYESGQLINGYIDGTPRGQAFPNNFEFQPGDGASRSYKREKDKAFRLTANFGGYPCTIAIPPPLVSTPLPPPPLFVPVLEKYLDAKDMTYVGFVPQTDRPVYLSLRVID